jgi:hypothetical protein
VFVSTSRSAWAEDVVDEAGADGSARRAEVGGGPGRRQVADVDQADAGVGRESV